MKTSFIRQLIVGFLISLILWAGNSQAGEELTSKSFESTGNAADTSFPTQLATPINIGVSMVVHKISNLNESDSSFSALLDLALRWKDPSLAFDPVKEGTDRKKFNGADATRFLSKIWTPGVQVENMAGSPEHHKDGILVYPDGTIKYNQRILATFRHNYDLSNFPFDRQNLPITLASEVYDTNKVIFVHDQIDVDQSSLRSDGIKLPGWTSKKDLRFLISRMIGWDKSYYSQIEATVVAERNSKNHIPGTYFPFALIMLVPTVLSLWSKGVNIEESMNAWAGSILTLLALVFTVAIQYPLLQPDNVFYMTFWTGFGFQLVMLSVVGTLYNPSVRSRLGNDFILDEVCSVLRWTMPLGLLIFLGRMLALSIYSYSS
ncbi:MAG: hypothetical protein K9J75_10810 [Cyanobium usitatum Tobar12.5m-G36]|nr:hypothetical protein [Cyanobium usitatum Tobar12.5m-G36]